MPPTVSSQKKKRGPAPTGKGQMLGVRVQPPEMARLDAWIASQPDPKPSRPEAIRRLVDQALGGADAGSIPNALKREQRRLEPDTVEFFVWSVPTAFQIIRADRELDAAEMFFGGKLTPIPTVNALPICFVQRANDSEAPREDDAIAEFWLDLLAP